MVTPPHTAIANERSTCMQFQGRCAAPPPVSDGGGWGEADGEADGEGREGEAGDRVVVVGAANNAGAGFR